MNHSFLNIMYKVCAVFLLSIASMALYSCSCGCGAGNTSDVPLSVLTRANDFIITRTGKDFFDKYITADFALIKYDAPNYKMAYRFFMPEKPYVNGLITFTVDSLGDVLDGSAVTGIPEYKANPESCNFLIDEKGAIQSAQKSGLEEGVAKWKVGLVWDGTLDRYTWHVLSTFSQSGEKKDYKGNGKELLIDPGNGKILAVNYWHVP